MRVTYTFDERTEDGFTAWRSIQHFKRIVEDPDGRGPRRPGRLADGVVVEGLARMVSVPGGRFRVSLWQPIWGRQAWGLGMGAG